MKTVIRRPGLLVKLGLFAGLLVTGQAAIAQDTAADTDVTNQAFVSFSIGTVMQGTVPSNEVTFKVDRRVDFDVSLEAAALKPIVPNEPGVFLEFLVTNESNDTLDFDLAQAALNNGDSVRSTTSTGETLDAVSIEVAPDFIGGGGTETPSRGANINAITGLPAGETIRVYIYADAPASLPDAAIPAIRLSVTAALGGSPLVDNSGDADDPAVVQNVFVNAPVGNNAILSNEDGFTVSAATVAAVKRSEVLSDPVTTATGGSNPKAIPLAVVEYSIELTNNGSVPADSIVITDTLDVASVELLNNTYGSDNVDLGGGATCVADTVATDGCTFDTGTGALSVTLPVSLGAGATVTVRFQVRIL